MIDVVNIGRKFLQKESGKLGQVGMATPSSMPNLDKMDLAKKHAFYLDSFYLE